MALSHQARFPSPSHVFHTSQILFDYHRSFREFKGFLLVVALSRMWWFDSATALRRSSNYHTCSPTRHADLDGALAELNIFEAIELWECMIVICWNV